MTAISEVLGTKRRVLSDQKTVDWALRLQKFEGITETQIRAIAANQEFVEKKVVPFRQALDQHDIQTALQIFKNAPYTQQVVFTLWLSGKLEIAPVRQSFIEKHG